MDSFVHLFPSKHNLLSLKEALGKLARKYIVKELPFNFVNFKLFLLNFKNVNVKSKQMDQQQSYKMQILSIVALSNYEYEIIY